MKAASKPRKPKPGILTDKEPIMDQVRPCEPMRKSYGPRPWNKTQASADYSEKLKDPRWQRKRLEVMGRDCFTCRECCATDKQLNVHHRYYIKGRAPWDYPMFAYLTLCKDCHLETHYQPDDGSQITAWEWELDFILTPENELFHFGDFVCEMKRAAKHGINMEEITQRLRRTCDKIEEDAKTAQIMQQ